MKNKHAGAPGLATSRAQQITNIRFAAGVPRKSISRSFALEQRRRNRRKAFAEFVCAFLFLASAFFLAGMGGY